MGTNYRVAMTLSKLKRVPTRSDFGQLGIMSAKFQAENCVQDTHFLRMIDCGKWNFAPDVREMAKGVPGGLSLDVMSVSEYGECRVLHYSTGADGDFLYEECLNTAEIAACNRKKADTARKDRQQEALKVKEAELRKDRLKAAALNKLSAEERQALGLS